MSSKCFGEKTSRTNYSFILFRSSESDRRSVAVLDDFLAWVEEAVEEVGGHQWFHGQCGKLGGAEQTDDIETFSGSHPDRAG